MQSCRTEYILEAKALFSVPRIFMLRFAIFAIVALRVTLCPLFCAANAIAAHSGKVTQQHSCCCVDCPGDTLTNEETLAPRHCPSDPSAPCCPGSVCQVTIDKSDRILLIMSSELLDSKSRCIDRLTNFIVRVVPIQEHPLRYDRRCGRTIRNVFESLLI